ncbi:MAG: type II toxin-antitoxin system prevent-host-death family antitoxin [Oscillatoriales cyanobacterium]|nr:MAG: type II toxin-antitoxin system prevent-host-death family antitoxin [Oscillatoriales cyanobacterium]
MLNLSHSRPLNQFQQEAPELLHQFETDKTPIVITINGKAVAVLQDAESYEKLLNRLEFLEIIKLLKSFKKNMTYRVEISPTAINDIENIFLWLKLNAPEKSYRWVRGCYEIILKLESFPSRCPLALESEYLDLEIRQLLYEKKYRILFSIVEDENTRMVKIHRVRHSSQQNFDSLKQLLDNDEEE